MLPRAGNALPSSRVCKSLGWSLPCENPSQCCLALWALSGWITWCGVVHPKALFASLPPCSRCACPVHYACRAPSDWCARFGPMTNHLGWYFLITPGLLRDLACCWCAIHCALPALRPNAACATGGLLRTTRPQHFNRWVRLCCGPQDRHDNGCPTASSNGHWVGLRRRHCKDLLPKVMLGECCKHWCRDPITG